MGERERKRGKERKREGRELTNREKKNLDSENKDLLNKFENYDKMVKTTQEDLRKNCNDNASKLDKAQKKNIEIASENTQFHNYFDTKDVWKNGMCELSKYLIDKTKSSMDTKPKDFSFLIEELEKGSNKFMGYKKALVDEEKKVKSVISNIKKNTLGSTLHNLTSSTQFNDVNAMQTNGFQSEDIYKRMDESKNNQGYKSPQYNNQIFDTDKENDSNTNTFFKNEITSKKSNRMILQ